jgi:uncharacterized CHY-type Zn-finger protein
LGGFGRESKDSQVTLYRDMSDMPNRVSFHKRMQYQCSPEELLIRSHASSSCQKISHLISPSASPPAECHCAEYHSTTDIAAQVCGTQNRYVQCIEVFHSSYARHEIVGNSLLSVIICPRKATSIAISNGARCTCLFPADIAGNVYTIAPASSSVPISGRYLPSPRFP